MNGKVVLLNGAPRSGKTSIVRAMQSNLDGVWMNVGVDAAMRMTPEKVLPGVGLRPGGERPDLEDVRRRMYRALFSSIAAHAREGLNVAADFGIYGEGVWRDCAERLEGVYALVVYVACSLDEITRRRRLTGYSYKTEDGLVPEPVIRWQKAVQPPVECDLKIDSSLYTPDQCVRIIRERLNMADPPCALKKILGRP